MVLAASTTLLPTTRQTIIVLLVFGFRPSRVMVDGVPGTEPNTVMRRKTKKRNGIVSATIAVGYSTVASMQVFPL